MWKMQILNHRSDSAMRVRGWMGTGMKRDLMRIGGGGLDFDRLVLERYEIDLLIYCTIFLFFFSFDIVDRLQILDHP